MLAVKTAIARPLRNDRLTITKAAINGFAGLGFEDQKETCSRESATTMGFKSDTYDDVDAIEFDLSHLENRSRDYHLQPSRPPRGGEFARRAGFSVDRPRSRQHGRRPGAAPAYQAQFHINVPPVYDSPDAIDHQRLVHLLLRPQRFCATHTGSPGHAPAEPPSEGTARAAAP